MKYLIEDRVIFRPDDGTFWAIGHEDEKVILPPIVARLMTLLLEEQGNVLTRDEIMERVWTIHGLEPSGNSLNQYISNIRRNFLNAGLGDNVIKTIPRIGFIFSGEIKVEKQLRPEAENSFPVEEASLPRKVVKTSSNHKLFYSTLFVFSAIIIATPWLVSRSLDVINEHHLEIKPVSIGTINQCHVQTVKMDNASRNPNIHLVAQKIFDNANIHCENKETAFLFVQNSSFHNEPGRIFISACKKLNGDLISCKNQSFNNWR
ncbi:transcriptional regulator [Enterobacteriaceae bacterium C23F]